MDNFHLCHVWGSKREATNSNALFPGGKIVPIKILATMLLTFKFDEPAASPNSLVVCRISFPRKQSFKQENQPSLVKSQQVM